MRNNSKVQCSKCLLYWNQAIVYCTCGHLLRESESSQHFHQWRLGAFLIPNNAIKKDRHRGVRHSKIEAQKEHFVATTHGGDASKRNLMEFTIASKKIQHIVIRSSKLAGLRRRALQWTKLAQENHSYCPLPEEFERYRKIEISDWTNQAEMLRWNSDQTSEKQSQLWTVSTANLEKSDLNQSLFINTKGGIRLLLLPVPHGGSGLNTGGAHNFFFQL